MIEIASDCGVRVVLRWLELCLQKLYQRLFERFKIMGDVPGKDVARRREQCPRQ